MPDSRSVEQVAMRRITLRLIPFLMLCYFVAFVDRVNVGFAGHDLSRDLGLSATVFGFGSGVFFLTYFSSRCRATCCSSASARGAGSPASWSRGGWWRPAWRRSPGQWSFYGVRALLGLAEAGFFPGVILYLTYWFPRKHRAKIVGYFMLAIPVSTFLGSPVSGLILDEMDGLGGPARVAVAVRDRGVAGRAARAS